MIKSFMHKTQDPIDRVHRGIVVIALLLALFCSASSLRAGQFVSSWVERDDGSSTTFAVQDGSIFDRWHVKGLQSGKWYFLIKLVDGKREHYEKQDIRISNPGALKRGGPMAVTIVDGEITVDRRERTLVIKLRVQDGDAVRDFEGNGRYEIPKPRK